MTIDYGKSIYFMQTPGTFGVSGAMVGGTFLPSDMIRQLYEKLYFSELMNEKGKCKPIPDNNIYEFYQWDGNPQSIENVQFLKKYNGTFHVGGEGFGKYHLDYQEQGEVHNIFPGDYIVNKAGNNNEISVSIYKEEDFKKKFMYR